MKRYLLARGLWRESDEHALNEKIGDDVNEAIKIASVAVVRGSMLAGSGPSERRLFACSLQRQ